MRSLEDRFWMMLIVVMWGLSAGTCAVNVLPENMRTLRPSEFTEPRAEHVWWLVDVTETLRDMSINRHPPYCKLEPIVHDWTPPGCWSAWSVFDEDHAAGENLYIACVQDNVWAYAQPIPRRLGTWCESAPWLSEPAPRIVCAIATAFDDPEGGADAIERIYWVECQTSPLCARWVCMSGSCCTPLFEEPGSQCKDGSPNIEAGALSFRLEQECYEL